MNKLIKNGYTAIVYSPGYGIGWSTRDDIPGMCLDGDIAQAVIDENYTEAYRIAKIRYDPNLTDIGTEDLRVCWVKTYTNFSIIVHDGFERVVLVTTNHLTA